MVTSKMKGYTRIGDRIDNAIENAKNRHSPELGSSSYNRSSDSSEISEYLADLGEILKGKYSRNWNKRLEDANNMASEMRNRFGSTVENDLESVLYSVGNHDYLSKKYFSGKSEANDVSNKYIETFNSIYDINDKKENEVAGLQNSNLEESTREESKEIVLEETKEDNSYTAPSPVGFFRNIPRKTKKVAASVAAGLFLAGASLGAMDYVHNNQGNEEKKTNVSVNIDYPNSDFNSTYSQKEKEESGKEISRKDLGFDESILFSGSPNFTEFDNSGNSERLEKKTEKKTLPKDISEYSIEVIDKDSFSPSYEDIELSKNNSKKQPSTNINQEMPKKSKEAKKSFEGNGLTLDMLLNDAKIIRESQDLLSQNTFQGPYENLERIRKERESDKESTSNEVKPLEKKNKTAEKIEALEKYTIAENTEGDDIEKRKRLILSNSNRSFVEESGLIPKSSEKESFFNPIKEDFNLYSEQVKTRNCQIEYLDTVSGGRTISLDFRDMSRGVGREFSEWNNEMTDTSNIGYSQAKTKKRAGGLKKILTAPVDSALGIVSGGRWGLDKEKIQERKKHNPLLGSIMSLYDFVEGEKEGIVNTADIALGGLADKTVNDFIGQGIATGINSAGHVLDYGTAIPFRGAKEIEELLVRNKGQISQHAYETLSTATRFGGNVILHEAPLKGKYVEVIGPSGEKEILNKGELGATLESIAATIIDFGALVDDGGSSEGSSDGDISGSGGTGSSVGSSGISGSGGFGGPVGG